MLAADFVFNGGGDLRIGCESGKDMRSDMLRL